MSQIEEISTVTAKGQTTVPKAVRKALGVDYGGRIAFQIDGGNVSIRRADAEPFDPAIESFLVFLGKDMEQHPDIIQKVSSDLMNRINALVDGVAVEENGEIKGPVDL